MSLHASLQCLSSRSTATIWGGLCRSPRKSLGVRDLESRSAESPCFFCFPLRSWLLGRRLGSCWRSSSLGVLFGCDRCAQSAGRVPRATRWTSWAHARSAPRQGGLEGVVFGFFRLRRSASAVAGRKCSPGAPKIPRLMTRSCELMLDSCELMLDSCTSVLTAGRSCR